MRVRVSEKVIIFAEEIDYREMARIELSENVTLRGARRILTKRGSAFWITRRHGKLYTIKKFSCEQPNTEAQMRCREVLRRANEIAREELAKEGGREKWGKMAEEMGYKTAIGCARAYYMAKMKGVEMVGERSEVVGEMDGGVVGEMDGGVVGGKGGESVKNRENEIVERGGCGMTEEDKKGKVGGERGESGEGEKENEERRRERNGERKKSVEVIRIERIVQWKSVRRRDRGLKKSGWAGDERGRREKEFC